MDAQSGRLVFRMGAPSQYGGTFTGSGLIEFNSGTWTDAGGVYSGLGTNLFSGGTFNLRTNPPPGLKFTGGDLYITGTNTFQQAGAITNLTLDVSVTLHGTNTVGSGTLTFNGGSIVDQLSISAAGQWLIGGASGKSIYNLTILNQGSVQQGAALSFGTTMISNGGLWQVTGDYNLSYGGGTTPVWTNSGTLKKTAGGSTTSFTGMNFYNQPTGLVQVDSGTLQLPVGSTNFAGKLRLNGGTLNANGTFAVAGGSLEGSGTFGANAFTGGTLTPGTNSSGLMTFSSGLNLNSNVTLVIDGTGPLPGVSYDQVSVIGTVNITNCNLQVAAMPTVPAGTTFVIISNDGVDAVNGTFNGLPENALVTVASQAFRIHYAGGTGNDVTLVRDGVVVGPLLSLQGSTNGTRYFSGSGAIPVIGYTLRATTNFVTWTNIGVSTSSVSGVLNFIDTNAWRFAYRFYSATN